jgi:hypothetical protein
LETFKGKVVAYYPAKERFGIKKPSQGKENKNN